MIMNKEWGDSYSNHNNLMVLARNMIWGELYSFILIE